jgi:hypothetical protein
MVAKAQIALALCGWIWAFAYVLLSAALLFGILTLKQINKMELNWDNAKAWEEKANEKKEIFDEPKWSWDCNFKLDFDGSLLRVSSRIHHTKTLVIGGKEMLL